MIFSRVQNLPGAWGRGRQGGFDFGNGQAQIGVREFLRWLPGEFRLLCAAFHCDALLR
jgi:hypothetical protein